MPGTVARQATAPIDIQRRGAYWRFDFDANAFLHHMMRNIMGCLVAVGQGQHPSGWMADVLAARTATRRRRPSRPTACISWARTTMPGHALPDTRLRMIGCPEPDR
jgi:tRNA pseudouridine38-40 synthase